jgi:hypothetical protein
MAEQIKTPFTLLWHAVVDEFRRRGVTPPDNQLLDEACRVVSAEARCNGRDIGEYVGPVIELLAYANGCRTITDEWEKGWAREIGYGA